MTAISRNATNTLFTTKNMAKIAILSAVSAVLMLLEFPLPIAPSFYKMDFSEVGVLIGGFALGPTAAIVIEALKILIKFLLKGSFTMGVGELSNFIIGCAMCVPAAMIYKKEKTRKNALIGLCVGTVCMTVIGVVMNYFVAIPAYVAIAHYPLDVIISMGAAIFPFIKNTFQLVIACVTPFNLIKGVLVSIVTCLLYKHVSPLLKR
ncbi:MAG: ECF transporter S component [Erysipelotrichaceae bacterium]|nr:ECF transporter S component [Erysipelotrichaceae bacterium]